MRTKKQLLHDAYEERKELFQKIIEFLKSNQQYTLKYHLDYLDGYLLSARNAKEKIRRLYVNAINSGGGNNLSISGTSCRNFFNIIHRLSELEKVDLQDFFLCFDESIKDFSDLFQFLVKSGSLKGFRAKKAALFIRDINLIESKGKNYIFNKFQCKKDHIYIPVDIVIVEMLTKLLRLDKKNFSLEATKDFHLINEFAKDILGHEFLLIEELWFWGFFNLVKTKDKVERELKFNEDKYYADIVMYPSVQMYEKFMDFNKMAVEIYNY